MTARIELVLLRGEEERQRVVVETRLVLGRSTANDLVLADDGVSSHHAVVSRDGDVVRVADLKSTNGTWVNEVRVVGDRELSHGDRLRIGPAVELEVRIHGEGLRPAGRLPLLRDLDAGIRYTFDADRLHIGAGADCTVRLSAGPERAATLLVDPDGQVWLGLEGEQRPVALGETFQVGGCQLILEPANISNAPTLKSARSTRYPYRLHATLDGPGGAVATLQHLHEGLAHQVTSENRAILLYLLARQLASDHASRRDPASSGWCDDQDVVVGIWGRAAAEQTSSALNVLVHRVRREIEVAGFDPWCIEKRRGATRVRVDAVEV